MSYHTTISFLPKHKHTKTYSICKFSIRELPNKQPFPKGLSISLHVTAWDLFLSLDLLVWTGELSQGLELFSLIYMHKSIQFTL